MNNLGAMLCALAGIHIGATHCDVLLINGEFSFVIAGIYGCVLYCALKLLDHCFDAGAFLYRFIKLKWLQRKINTK